MKSKASELSRKYIVSLCEYNWHDGGYHSISFAEGKNEKEALLNRLRKFYRWLKTFGESFLAYIEDVKVYEYLDLGKITEPPVYVIRGPLLEIEGRITNQEIMEMDEEQFLNYIEKKIKRGGKKKGDILRLVKRILG